MNKEVKVSIILPTYNGSKYIKVAIESVLTQTFTLWELIVIDDGSNDNTEETINVYTLKDKRIIYLKNENNLGIQKTLNKGLKEAKGKYIARIDDDDEWIDKDKLEKQVDFLENNPSYVLVGTGVIVINEESLELFRYLLPKDDKSIRNKILSKNCFIHSSVVFKKDSALIFGGYNESNDTKHIEDYDLWLKLGTVGKLSNLPIYAVKFTIRDDSISSTNKIGQFEKNINLLKRYKNKYPNYKVSMIKSNIRFLIYKLISKLPIKSIYYDLMKFYKKNW
jgi:glycosyltransferase involved in cell wall biosynthesis